jgi:DHA1 family inner membrane transport protein
MDVAGDAQTLAAALNHSAFNVANALGALFGGMAITAGYGYGSMGFVGAATAVIGFGVFLLSLALEKADRTATPACPAE